MVRDGDSSVRNTHFRYPLQLAGIYAALASLWILFSDYLVAVVFHDPYTYMLVSSAKGLTFVGLTAILLFGLASRLVSKVERANLLNQHTQKLLSELLDNSPDAIFAKDAVGRYILANREVARVTGKAMEDILGQNDYALFPAEQVEMLIRNDQAVLGDGQVLQRTEHLSTVDGELVYMVTKGPLHDVNGQINGLFGIARDITGSEQEKNKLQETLATLRASQQIGGIGSYLLDIRSGRWESSDVLDHLLGISSQDDHTVEGWSKLIAPVDRESATRYFAEQVLGEKKPFDLEYRIIRQNDGQERWVHGMGGLEFDDDGTPIRMRGTIQDVTERIRAETVLRESESRFRALVEQSMVGIFIIQDDFFRYVNPGFARMHGFASPAEIIDIVPIMDLVAAQNRAAISRQIHAQLAGAPGKTHYVFTGLHQNGEPIELEMYGQLFVHQGRPALLGLAIDITSRLQAEEELRIAAIAFEAQDGIMVTNAQAVIQKVNQAFTRITGYSEEEVVGKTPQLLHSGMQDASFYAAMRAELARSAYWQGELCNRRKDGSHYIERLTISAVTNPAGEVSHYVASFSDVTLQREAESQVRHLAYYDALTDLPNRRLLYDRLEHAQSWSARSAEYYALLFIDLDNFKRVNDTIGHRAGDELLVLATQRIKKVVRESDTLARFGGDEFVVVLEELGTEVGQAARRAGQVGEKLRQVLAEQYQVEGHAFYCTASIGVTLFIGEECSLESILMHADLAMYRAKSDGRNALRFFEENMQTELARRTALEADLRIGIDAGQFLLYYQPQLNREGRIIGAEALVRWNHPQRGMLAPGQFIYLAEDSGLILPLGTWILQTACQQLKRWAGLPSCQDLVLAVNVSARQFAQPGFVRDVLQTLTEAGADARKLKIEITESIVLDDLDDALLKMKQLRAHGITFSLDDFGTGSSSLSYLTRLPLDQLKIDKSFVDGLPDSKQDAMVAQTIITMAQGLGMEVIAEGVESKAQQAFLMQHGCDAFQGYLFGKPMPDAQFEQTIGQQAMAQQTE